MPPKTLHLTNSWHDTSGGIATFYRALMDEANHRGWEMRLVVPAAVDRVEEVGKFGRIYHVAAPPALLNSRYRMIYPPQFLQRGGRLRSILALERPDVVEICDKYTLHYFGALLRMRMLADLDFKPVVVGLSCERMDDNFRSYLGSLPLRQAFCSWYMRWIYFPFFDHHIANSPYTAGELQAASRGHVVPRGAWVRPMGVDIDYLSPQRRSPAMRLRLLQNFGASEESVLLLYTGRLAPEKNLALLFSLIDFLAKNSKHDFRLLVAGDGIEREAWEKRCHRTSPGRVMFLGHIGERNVLADLYANADFFVHPNPREPFGIAPLEAMASGLPLLAPNSGGVMSYASNDTAWLAAPTLEGFAAALEAAVASEALRRAKAVRALARAQDFRWSKVAASFLDLYGEFHEASRSRRPIGLPPDFLSQPATPLQGALFHGITQAAQKMFAFVSRLAHPNPGTRSTSQPGTRPTAT